MQKNLFNFNSKKKMQKKKQKLTYLQKRYKAIKKDRIKGVRFCPEVPDSECHGCGLASKGHPLVLDSTTDLYKGSTYHKLCTKDCLKMKVPLKHNKVSGTYDLLIGGYYDD